MTSLNLLAILCPVRPRQHSSPLSQGCTAGLFHLGVYQDLHVLSTKLLSSCLWLLLSSCRILHFPTLNFMMFLHAPLCAVQPFGTPATPPSSVSTANLLRVHSAPFSRYLMKILNRTGPSIDSWDTVASQLDFVPLTVLPLFNPVIKSQKFITGQALLPLGETMLTAPYNLLVLHMPGNFN